jgi:hypothetical protein
MNRVSRAVSRLGVTVVSVARPNELRELFGRFEVVTLVGHFRLARVMPSDVLDTRRLLELVRQPLDDVQRELRAWCERNDPGLLRDDPTPPQERLAAAIDALVAAAHADYTRYSTWNPSDVRAPADELPPLFARLTRVAFEESLGPTILPAAPAVELLDGLFTIPAVVEVVPEEFSGVIDLGLCNSVILGGAIRRRRERPRALIGRWLADAVVPWSVYNLVIQELAIKPAPYIATTVTVRETVAEVFAQEVPQ